MPAASRPLAHRRALRVLTVLVAVLALLLAGDGAALAADADPGSIGVTLPTNGDDPGVTLSLLGIFTLITLGPSILIMMTGFARILIVLSFLRQALGTAQVPPNQLLVGFALFLTLFVMGPTFERVNDVAVQPYLAKEIGAKEAVEKAQVPLRAFMLRQTGRSELAMFVKLSREPAPRTEADLKLTTLIPAFMVSEVKTAFQIGFLIYVPFVIIDMVVASTLMSMGMMMLPPAMISLPFKLLLFVLVDGWALLAQNLVAGFNT
jgi:flagellar biosynthetic protein FliP